MQIGVLEACATENSIKLPEMITIDEKHKLPQADFPSKQVQRGKRKILVAMKPQDRNHKPFLFAISKLAFPGDSVHVLSVVDEKEIADLFYMDQLNGGNKVDELVNHDATSMARYYHSTFELPSDVEFAFHVKIGDPRDVIVKTCAEEEFDFVVVGYGSAENLMGFIMGKTSDYIVNHCNCPVVVCNE